MFSGQSHSAEVMKRFTPEMCQLPSSCNRAVARAAPRVRRNARRAALHVRSGVDSPMETRLRMLLVLAGLPEPVVNHVIRWEDGRVRYRFDLSWPQWRLVVEYDGRQHRDDLDQWDTDIARRDWMDAKGWSFVPVVARGVHRRPDETLERVRSALVRRPPRTILTRTRPGGGNHRPLRTILIRLRDRT